MIIAGVADFPAHRSEQFLRAATSPSTPIMADSAGMADNAPVRLNGILVGQIEASGSPARAIRSGTVESTW